MRLSPLLLSLALACAAAPACADSIRVGGHVLNDGDPVGKVSQLLGKPDRVVQNQNRFGATLSEDYEYYRDGKTLRITVEGGKVTAISEAR